MPVGNCPDVEGLVGIGFQLPHFMHFVHKPIRCLLCQIVSIEHRMTTRPEQVWICKEGCGPTTSVISFYPD